MSLGSQYRPSEPSSSAQTFRFDVSVGLSLGVARGSWACGKLELEVLLWEGSSQSGCGKEKQLSEKRERGGQLMSGCSGRRLLSQLLCRMEASPGHIDSEGISRVKTERRRWFRMLWVCHLHPRLHWVRRGERRASNL